jgi:hypothetical protein
MRTAGHGLRILALGALLLAPATLPALAGGGAGGPCAAAAGRPHAALVVDTGSDATTYCVALDAATVNGLHLIQLAGSQFGLHYRLGFGGQAVCMLADVGATGNDCFGAYPDYWGYWHGDGAGSWAWAGSGAGSARIGDGDMDGWVWGPGDSGTSHAAPPALALADVCVPSPSPSPSPSPKPSPGGGGSGGSGGGSGDGGGGSGSDGGAGSGGGSGNALAPSVAAPAGSPTPRPSTRSSRTPGPDVAASPSSTVVDGETVHAAAPIAPGSGGSGGPPTAGLVAVGAAALLGLGGWMRVRRRPKATP